MSSHRLIRFTPLGTKKSFQDSKGFTPLIAKQMLQFLNEETAEVFKTTDLRIRKSKKAKKFLQFLKAYESPFKSGDITIIGFVIDYSDEILPQYLIKEIKKRLKRMNVEILGYIGIRDIGDNKFQRHIHLLIALRKISREIFDKIKGKPSEKKAVAEIYDLKGIVFYLIKKELYAGHKSRPYFFSSKFRKL